MIRLLALCLALLATPLRADVTVSFDFAFSGDASEAPQARLQVTDLLASQPIEVIEGAGEPGHRVVSFVVPTAAFDGPYARLRLVFSDLRLPADDAKADQSMVFATEMILRRDQLADTTQISVPVVTSSRKGAIKPAMGMPQVAEEVTGRYFMAQQWASLYTASAEAVAAAPESFGLQRMISRALADFSIAMAQARPGAVLLIPSEEMGALIKQYWGQGSDGRATHLRAYQEARTALWLDLAGVEGLLRQARRAGVEGPQFCARAKAMLDFFERHSPLEDEARLVDLIFPNPGTLQAYLAGRRLDEKYSCTRYSF